jgi:hypothetical protein
MLAAKERCGLKASVISRHCSLARRTQAMDITETHYFPKKFDAILGDLCSAGYGLQQKRATAPNL